MRGFSTLPLLTFWEKSLLLSGLGIAGCSAASLPFTCWLPIALPSRGNQICLQTLPGESWGARLPQLRTIDLKYHHLWTQGLRLYFDQFYHRYPSVGTSCSSRNIPYLCCGATSHIWLLNA